MRRQTVAFARDAWKGRRVKHTEAAHDPRGGALDDFSAVPATALAALGRNTSRFAALLSPSLYFAIAIITIVPIGAFFRMGVFLFVPVTAAGVLSMGGLYLTAIVGCRVTARRHLEWLRSLPFPITGYGDTLLATANQFAVSMRIEVVLADGLPPRDRIDQLSAAVDLRGATTEVTVGEFIVVRINPDDTRVRVHRMHGWLTQWMEGFARPLHSRNAIERVCIHTELFTE